MFSVCSKNDTGNSTVSSVDAYYEAVVSCIKDACLQTVPSRKCGTNFSEYVVPGWNDYVSEKHSDARNAFLDWVLLGKPRQGHAYYWMRKTRAQFKLAYRYCIKHEVELRADAMANSLVSKDFKKFWKHISKTNNSKASKFAHVVDGYTGDDAIADRWRVHFEQLYNDRDDSTKGIFYEQLSSAMAETKTQNFSVTIQDVLDACAKQKQGKAVGEDGIAMEALIYGGHRLHVHICALFNLFLKYGYVPRALMQSVIVPLVKNKSGNLSDMNNYRAIATSTAFSKLFESVIAVTLHTDTVADKYQFVFRPGHSTSLCTSVFKQSVQYFTARGSHVFSCFIDFSKAFDKVNYWKLFLKLMDDCVDYNVIKVSAFWFCNQECSVRWRSSISASFHIFNGTRQGGVLSPYLFTRYIRDLLTVISSSGIGCKVGGHPINILAYADDIVLIAPSWKALQKLLNILNEQASLIDMVCNADKTVCMMFAPKQKDRVIATNFPLFRLGTSSLKFVQQFKYLGHIISCNQRDDEDIQREIRNMFIRTNILTRRFSRCSIAVKVLLFKSFCLCLYDVALWSSYYISSINKFRSCYNKCMKLFFGYNLYASVTNMLLEIGLPSFDTLLWNCRTIFKRCERSCNNDLVVVSRH